MKKTVSLLLALLMLAAVLTLASCGKTPPDESGAATTAGPDPVDTTPEYTFPEADYNNEPFVVYNRIHANYGAEYIVSSDMSGDIVNDAVFTRNARVENKYKVQIKTKDAENPCNDVRPDVASGDVDYDILLDRRIYLSTLTNNSVLADFNELGLDYSNTWWDRHCVSDLSVKGRTYLMQCDVSIAKFTNIRFFYFNKEIIDSYHLTDPYALYDKNEWTLDNFLTMVKGVSAPQADGSLGTYGLVIEEGPQNGVYMHMLTGIGVKYSNLNADGLVEEAISSQLDKIDTYTGKISAVFNDPNYALTMNAAVEADRSGSATGNNVYDQARSLWAQGHFLFTQSSIAATTQFRDMAYDYGIMPNPKYDKDQAEYAHKCDKYALCFAIPLDNSVDMERLAVIMDYWAYTSSDVLIPAYYDVTIKARRFSDPKASVIMDKIRDTVRYEFCDVFDISEMPNAIYEGYTSNTFSSTWNANREAITGKINEINERFK